MCGIVGYTGPKDSTSIVFSGLKRLEYRGYDSAGIALALENESIHVHKATGRVRELEAKFNPISNVVAAIGHTRWASHGEVSHKNAHPHESKGVTIVHNGVIDNASELRTRLESEGYKFVSDTDSETIAHLIDLHNTGDPLATIQKATAELQGTYGIAVLFKDLPGLIVAAKNGSPLVIGIGDTKDYYVASDTTALTQHTNRFIYMEDGDIAVIRSDCDILLNNERSIEKIDEPDAYAELGNFEHFMLKEICEQPDAIKRCFSSRVSDTSCKLKGFNLTDEQLSKTTSVTIIGCGTSYHAGLVVKEYIERWCGVPCFVELASEFANKYILPDKTGIYLAISQSGETFDTLECIKELHKKGIDVYGVVNTVGSSIARLCRAGVYTHAGPEISVASTKAFTTQLAALIMFACMLGRSKQMNLAEGYYLCKELRKLPEKLESFIAKLLNGNDNISLLLAEAPYVLFLGRGVSYPIAMEGSLKLKEIAYIPCEAYAGGEMKHGPIAMIDKGTPVICLLPGDRHRKRMLTNMEEVKTRGAEIITVAEWGEDIDSILRISKHTWLMPDAMPLTTPFFLAVALQIFAYRCAKHLNNDIDKPKNLAKSVTIS